MAIGFGRIEFIKRSEGRNSCQLSAYLSRLRIFFEGNCALESKLYDFSDRESVPYHEILLPDGADENLRFSEVLWNMAERKEIRKDAQVSMHLVLALPDDKEVTFEDRIQLTRSFIQKQYKGLPAEIVIHPPERKIEFTEENEVLGIPKGTIGSVKREKEGNYIVVLPKGIRANPFVEIGTNYPGIAVREHNWHAHIQLTTRRLKENGKEFGDLKASDLMPVIKKGKVISGPDVGKLWAKHQNEFFLSKGLALRVDENGIVPQEHLGPARMRGRAFALLEEHERRLELNGMAASDPQNILNAITKRQSVFTKEDVERFMVKHVPGDKIQEVRDGFWKLEEVVQLRSKETEAFLSKFSSKGVIQEEEQIVRLADHIHAKIPKSISPAAKLQFSQGLSEEQKKAYEHILGDKGLSCIQGYAGTGKSYLLKALKDAYEKRGLTVRSFGPDNATAAVLKDKGFSTSENIYRFLFSAKHGLRDFHKGFEIWILDEAGKLGNRPLLEFLKLAEAKNAKVILAGDAAQLPAVERGGIFRYFCERYSAESLEEIQRQKEEAARAMAKNLAKGEVGAALDKLYNQGAILWSSTRKEAIEELVLRWAADHRAKEEGSMLSKAFSLIIAGTNNEVRVLNELVRLIRKERGEISNKEFACETAHGTIYVSEGDRIEFRKNDRELGVTDGMTGVLLKAEKNCFSIAIQENGQKTRVISFNPQEYHSFQLGYASTCNRAQGRTVENAYVLHSPHLNKQMAYVELTRQIDKVQYFISKEDAQNLSDLKRRAIRDGSKASTLEYTYSQEIERKVLQKEREQRIDQLKQSDQFSERFKGKALDIWGRLQEKASLLIEKRADQKPSQEFFNFNKESQRNEKALVQEVLQDDPKRSRLEPIDAANKIYPQEVMQKVILQDKDITKNKETVKMNPITTEIEKDSYDQGFNSSDTSASSEKNAFSWKNLTKEKKDLLSSYYSAAAKASEVKDIVQAETAGDLEEKTTLKCYQEWQKACALRNEAAYQLKSHLSKEEFKETFGEKTAYYINLHASKYQEILKDRELKAEQALKIKNLDEQLLAHIEPLLYKLFPDGPSSKTSRGYRFGAKGSLSITHSGPKAGQFFDFERQEGGGRTSQAS